MRHRRPLRRSALIPGAYNRPLKLCPPEVAPTAPRSGAKVESVVLGAGAKVQSPATLLWGLTPVGATSGSRVEFIHEKDGKSYIMHKPHPANIIKGYVMRQVLSYLTTNGYLKEKED